MCLDLLIVKWREDWIYISLDWCLDLGSVSLLQYHCKGRFSRTKTSTKYYSYTGKLQNASEFNFFIFPQMPLPLIATKLWNPIWYVQVISFISFICAMCSFIKGLTKSIWANNKKSGIWGTSREIEGIFQMISLANEGECLMNNNIWQMNLLQNMHHKMKIQNQHTMTSQTLPHCAHLVITIKINH